MIDHKVRPLIDPPLNRVGFWLAKKGITANFMTALGFFLGICAIILIIKENFTGALIFLGLSRLADGLDGAIARHSKLSDFGGFFDIVCDFIFYSGFAYAFGFSDPVKLPYSSFLVFSFVGPMVSFLAYAIVAGKREIKTEIRGKKSFYYLGGICEGTETAFFFALFCLFPKSFTFLSMVFAGLCWLTTFGRVYVAWIDFNSLEEKTS